MEALIEVLCTLACAVGAGRALSHGESAGAASWSFAAGLWASDVARRFWNRFWRAVLKKAGRS